LPKCTHRTGVGVLGNDPIQLSAWILVVEIPIALAQLGLAIWMVIALRRYGTWARRKIVEPIPSQVQPVPGWAC